MRRGERVPDLLTSLAGAPSVEAGLAHTLRRLVALTGAAGGALLFRPPHAAPIAVAAGPRRRTRALLEAISGRDGATRLSEQASLGSSRKQRRGANHSGDHTLQVTLTADGRRAGRLALLGRGRPLKSASLPPGLGHELGAAIDEVWRRHRRTLRMTVLTEITRLLGSSDSL